MKRKWIIGIVMTVGLLGAATIGGRQAASKPSDTEILIQVDGLAIYRIPLPRF